MPTSTCAHRNRNSSPFGDVPLHDDEDVGRQRVHVPLPTFRCSPGNVAPTRPRPRDLPVGPGRVTGPGHRCRRHRARPTDPRRPARLRGRRRLARGDPPPRSRRRRRSATGRGSGRLAGRDRPADRDPHGRAMARPRRRRLAAADDPRRTGRPTARGRSGDPRTGPAHRRRGRPPRARDSCATWWKQPSRSGWSPSRPDAVGAASGPATRSGSTPPVRVVASARPVVAPLGPVARRPAAVSPPAPTAPPATAAPIDPGRRSAPGRRGRAPVGHRRSRSWPPRASATTPPRSTATGGPCATRNRDHLASGDPDVVGAGRGPRAAAGRLRARARRPRGRGAGRGRARR